jgi:glyoxylase-like metal-dependent hydrolase (beta-lactamase superfamily II)
MILKNRIHLIALSILLFNIVVGQNQKNLTEDSYKRARSTLDSAVQAHGRIDLLRTIRTITLKEIGTHRYLHQSPAVDPSFLATPREETTIVDFARECLRIDTNISDPNYYVSDSTTIIHGKEGYILDNRSREAAPITDPSIKNYRSHFFQRLPHYILLEALEQSSSLRFLGQTEYEGKQQNVISFLSNDNRQVSLYLKSQTNLLSKAEFIYSDAITGDGLFEIVFKDYRELEGMKIPNGRKIIISGETQVDTNYKEFQIGNQIQESTFTLPSGFEKVPSQETHNLTVNQISTDVYHVRGVLGTSNAFFVAFNEFIVVVDAPRSRLTGGASERLIEKIKETVPGKPIQYLVITTHSFDHSAGLRAFVAEGARVISTPGNQRYIEKLTEEQFTIVPDALARKPTRPVIEIIRNQKHVLSDANHTIELYDVGPNPIANEIIVVYFPKEKILYQTDLINPGYAGTLIPAQIGTVHFAKKIKEMGLPIQTILGGHGGELKMEDLDRALQKRQLLKSN